MKTENKFKAIIFDLDGTLLDSLEDLADGANVALKKLGFEAHPKEAYKTFVGDGVVNLLKRACPEGASDEIIQKAVKLKKEYYQDNWANKSCLYEGVSELLTSLKEKGIVLTVLSNKPDHFTQEIMKHFFSNWSFDLIYGAREGVTIKPNPQGVFDIIAELKLKREECLYVGDTNTDMQTAKNAELYALGVTWGFREEQELLENGASRIAHHPKEILELF